jgi:transcription elongation factor Elf1
MKTLTTEAQRAQSEQAVELLPCPFCGHEATLDQPPMIDGIECSNPDCPVRPGLVGLCREEVIAPWNRRGERAQASVSRKMRTPLPCPFCGGEPEVGGLDGDWYVWCSSPGCHISACAGPSPSRHAALTAWNSRAAKGGAR